MSIRLTRNSILYDNRSTDVIVYQGTLEGTTRVAIKDQFHSDIDAANQAITELMCQIQLEHPNICKVHECYLQAFQGQKVKSVLVVELMKQDVMKEIEERKATGRPWSEYEICKHLTDLVSALSYAQSKGVSHRDIKILEAATLKGSPFFMSPELKRKYSQQLLTNVVERVPYDPVKSDVYSLGVTLLYMATLEPPTQLTDLYQLETGTQAVLQQLTQFPYLQKYLGWMLAIEPEQRPSFTDIEHTWQGNADASSLPFPIERDDTDTFTYESEGVISLSIDVATAHLQVKEVQDERCAGCGLNLTTSETRAFIQLVCLHVFHSRNCFLRFLQENLRQFKNEYFLCPVCQAPISWDDVPDEEAFNILRTVQVYDPCVRCQGPLSFEPVKLDCPHFICQKDCFFTYLQTSSQNFSNRAGIVCPACYAAILNRCIIATFGKDDYHARVKSIKELLCGKCRKGDVFYTFPDCSHQFCARCLMYKSSFYSYCPMCK